MVAIRNFFKAFTRAKASSVSGSAEKNVSNLVKKEATKINSGKDWKRRRNNKTISRDAKDDLLGKKALEWCRLTGNQRK